MIDAALALLEQGDLTPKASAALTALTTRGGEDVGRRARALLSEIQRRFGRTAGGMSLAEDDTGTLSLTDATPDGRLELSGE